MRAGVSRASLALPYHAAAALRRVRLPQRLSLATLYIAVAFLFSCFWCSRPPAVNLKKEEEEGKSKEAVHAAGTIQYPFSGSTCSGPERGRATVL